MSDITARIAAHRAWGDGFCECGFDYGDDALKWAGHLVTELGLTEEPLTIYDATPVRYVTGWERESHGTV